MFNAFNAQQPYSEGAYQAWQTGYGNPQGNFGAAPGSYSFHGDHAGYQGQYGSLNAYGQQQGAWQTPNANSYAYPHEHGYTCRESPRRPEDSQPPLPNGAPPPLPPTPVEEPPPLPPDGPEAPCPPPLPPASGNAQPTPGHHHHHLPQQYEGQRQQQVAQPQGIHESAPASGAPCPADAWAQQHYQPQDYHSGAFPQAGGSAMSVGWYAQPHQHNGYGQPGMSPYGYPPSFPGYPQHTADYSGDPQFAHAHVQCHAPGAAIQQPLPPPQPHAPPQAQGSFQPGSSGAGAAAATGPVGQATAVTPTVVTPPPLAPVVIDITRLLRPPHRATRPRKLLLVLRGLPGSGKSSLARKIREAELEAGAEPPRLHSIDDYYMQETEVEVVEEDGGRKKRRKVTEMKYAFEPEMEGTYFRDLVRAVGRSCEDKRHSFVVVDAPVLRADQLRELMAVGQRANFECYALRPLETDPEVVASPGRNLHGHSLKSLRAMAAGWEDAPPLYVQVSAVSLFGGPVVGKDGQTATRGSTGDADDDIQEVDMDDDSGDAEDGDNGDVDGDGDSAGGNRSRWDDGAEAAHEGRRRASRWHDDHEDGARGGGRDSRQSQHSKRKKVKAARLKAAAAADIDDKVILSGLNEALAGQTSGVGQRSARAPAGWGRGSRPVRSVLRRIGSAAAVGGVAVTAASLGAAGTAKRRVWWPDLGHGVEAADNSSSPSPPPQAASGGARQQLVAVVVLEGLGPPPELEELPYGYQRKADVGPPGRGAGVTAAAAASASGDGVLGAHHNFRDQAKAEHESEHDLFRRLLFGKHAGPVESREASGGTPLGLFESMGQDDEDDS